MFALHLLFLMKTPISIQNFKKRPCLQKMTDLTIILFNHFLKFSEFTNFLFLLRCETAAKRRCGRQPRSGTTSEMMFIDLWIFKGGFTCSFMLPLISSPLVIGGKVHLSKLNIFSQKVEKNGISSFKSKSLMEKNGLALLHLDSEFLAL